MKRSSPAVFLLLVAVFVFSVSCATGTGTGHSVIFRSQGHEIAVVPVSTGADIAVPEDPIREGYSFNGWWVTCDEGVMELSEYLTDNTAPKTDIIANARWINESFHVDKLDFDTDGYIQDGAVFKHYLFKFHSNGDFAVYSMNTETLLGTGSLERSAFLKMHSNSVCFGSFFSYSDSFPLLYSNVYNSYSAEIEKNLGTVGVYRLGIGYSNLLVQVIRIGFTDTELWRSSKGSDRSPYGNFVVDPENNRIWFFVTRDETATTRFFCFDLPKVGSGTFDINTATMTTVLTEDDIIDMFDVPYSYYLQGACLHDGKIYSTEGMGTGVNPTVIRVIDLENRCEDSVVDLQDSGLMKEAELIDYWKDGKFIYGDYKGVNYPKTALYVILGI